MQHGDRLELEIAQPVSGGRMLARHNGQVVLVAGAIPGERVMAAVERVTRQIVWAHVVEVRKGSPDRRDGPRDPACGGLTYAHVRIDRQRDLKADVIADAFRRIAKHPLASPPPVAASPEEGYRLRARLHVARRRAGFFREGTHDLCDARQTGQLTDDALGAVDALLGALGDRAAECESVVIAENVAATERVIHLNGQPGARLDDLASGVELPAATTGVTASVGGRLAVLAGRAVVADTATELVGTLALREPQGTPSLSRGGSSTLEPRWTRHAASFFQGNRFLTGPLLKRVLAHATGEHIVDLYSGVGLFAVALAARGARVLAVEGDRTSGADLVENAEPWRERLDVLRQPVEEALHHDPAVSADTIIVDPPRTGLSPAALAGLIRWRAPRVVYVSCDPPTLARDARQLFGAGYELAAVEAFDFFPNTPHVETLAVFDGRSSEF